MNMRNGFLGLLTCSLFFVYAPSTHAMRCGDQTPSLEDGLQAQTEQSENDADLESNMMQWVRFGGNLCGSLLSDFVERYGHLVIANALYNEMEKGIEWDFEEPVCSQSLIIPAALLAIPTACLYYQYCHPMLSKTSNPVVGQKIIFPARVISNHPDDLEKFQHTDKLTFKSLASCPSSRMDTPTDSDVGSEVAQD